MFRKYIIIWFFRKNEPRVWLFWKWNLLLVFWAVQYINNLRVVGCLHFAKAWLGYLRIPTRNNINVVWIYVWWVKWVKWALLSDSFGFYSYLTTFITGSYLELSRCIFKNVIIFFTIWINLTNEIIILGQKGEWSFNRC